MWVVSVWVKILHAIFFFPNSQLHHMEPGNNTQIPEFLLLGLSEGPELQLLIFGLFLSMYLITVFGNLLIILAVSAECHLHTPMYFFLSNLSFADICFTSTTIPKMLQTIQTQRKVITYEGCIVQVYFYLLFAGLDNFLLTVMAYDRYVAICHPLQYTVIMNPWVCGVLVLVSWVLSSMYSLLQSLMILRLSFCSDLEIHHFFCEITWLIQLACSDPFLNNMVVYFGSVIIGGVPLAGILYSYSKIVASICGISSAQGQYKAFSTCASHLSVVSLFYCSALGVYLSFTATYRSHASAIVSVMYTVVTPMLNPFIYSLRNKDIKRALKRLFEMETFRKGPFTSGWRMIAGLKDSESDSEILCLNYGNSNCFFILLPGISISSISLLCTILKTSFINVSLLCHLSFFFCYFSALSNWFKSCVKHM